MALQFEPISLEQQDLYRERLKQSNWEASDYSFVNLWGWRKAYGLEWAWDDDLVWIRQAAPKAALWAPVGPWDQIDWPGRIARHFTGSTIFIRVPEPLIYCWRAAMGGRVAATAVEDQWDYLYSVPDLVELKGNRFHKKKNLLNQFRKKYDFAYLPLTPDMVEGALGMQEDWCVWRDCESDDTLASENYAIARVLANWESLADVSGGAILVDGEMAAFTVAEQMNEETVLIHFEKGLTAYKGIYQAINQMFLAENHHFRWVNREQDMGDEGLRRAKRSYHPVEFVRKYRVTLT